ncbi:prolipoprotein diacylglyceryl transferase [Chelatococcus reniformis]|uniref:Phosphatidylglycerol--prolipoprotein diacylglyceryl transferase n=1 Tax=Chelatococcus reniformis TaxID=1494448 RepID=A0A916UNL8_9HYPH|nr:prolipoprotein diacylglyceryl transferase [Chelatococcus reniformis]GGC80308.1 prolipoprotein diacylglyceryl transferase [Chelatococcus reniformis]
MPVLAIPFPVIDPVLVSIGPFAIRWYALAYIVGLVGGWLYARRLAATERLWGPLKRPTPADLDDLLVYVALGVVLGGRLGYVLFYDLKQYLEHPLDILAVWRGGMSFHGGFLGAVLGIFLLARSRKLSVLAMFDVAAAVAPIGLFLGRLANFVNGELWGRAAPDFPYAMVFPNGGPLPRHPSQLYEAFAEGLLLFVAVTIAVRLFGFRRPGLVSAVFAIGYALARTVCEFFREPDPQLGFLLGTKIAALGGGLTMGMLLCVPLFIAGVILLIAAASGRTRPRLTLERAAA